MKKSEHRPKSIRDFERVYIAGYMLFGLGEYLKPAQAAEAEQQRKLPELVLTVIDATAMAIVLGIAVLFWWLIVRRGSSVARWVYVVLEVAALGYGLSGIPETLAELEAVPAALMFGEYALVLLGLWLVVQPDANAWFAGRPDRLTDIFS